MYRDGGVFRFVTSGRLPEGGRIAALGRGVGVGITSRRHRPGTQFLLSDSFHPAVGPLVSHPFATRSFVALLRRGTKRKSGGDGGR